MARRHRPGRFEPDVLTVYGLLAGLLLLTLLMGLVGIGLARILFIGGCVAVAWRALKVGPGLHVEVVTILFMLAPFLRRVVDVKAGFNASGIMLVGPLLALALPVWELKALLMHRPRVSQSVYVPYLIVCACLVYGWALSAFAGEAVEATGTAIKMFTPVLYAMYLIHRYDVCEEVMQGVARAFLFTTPIIGVYGVVQYVLLPNWDWFWMVNSPALTAIGYPKPLQVRVYSTMNSPASFGTYAACGLLLYGFCKRSWWSVLMIFPISLGLLLSLYRTGWMSVGLGVGFCFLFNSTRSRASTLTLALIGAGLLAVLVTPFGQEIGERLASLISPSKDQSGSERLHEYMTLYSDMDHYLFGNGMARGLNVSSNMLGVDGQFIASPVMMGIMVGNIHVLALIWACLQSTFSFRQDTPPIWLVAGGIVVGNIILLPLAIISIGEISFPIWTFAALITARQQKRAADALQGRAVQRVAGPFVPDGLRPNGWPGPARPTARLPYNT